MREITILGQTLRKSHKPGLRPSFRARQQPQFRLPLIFLKTLEHRRVPQKINPFQLLGRFVSLHPALCSLLDCISPLLLHDYHPPLGILNILLQPIVDRVPNISARYRVSLAHDIDGPRECFRVQAHLGDGRLGDQRGLKAVVEIGIHENPIARGVAGVKPHQGFSRAQEAV